jgi:hypothetical protein
MTSLTFQFCDLINQVNEPGDVVEFGTGGGISTDTIASKISKDRKIFTFDGFVGLPKTNKPIPDKTDWYEGNLKFDENKTRELLKKHNNVFVEKVMTYELKHPNEYNINKIVGVNFDLDLYEGTLDGLRFIDKCEWKEIILRFDDWGCYSFQVAADVDAHEKAAFFDWINETKYQYQINTELLNLSNGLQSIIIVKR